MMRCPNSVNERMDYNPHRPHSSRATWPQLSSIGGVRYSRPRKRSPVQAWKCLVKDNVSNAQTERR